MDINKKTQLINNKSCSPRNLINDYKLFSSNWLKLPPVKIPRIQDDRLSKSDKIKPNLFESMKNNNKTKAIQENSKIVIVPFQNLKDCISLSEISNLNDLKSNIASESAKFQNCISNTFRKPKCYQIIKTKLSPSVNKPIDLTKSIELQISPRRSDFNNFRIYTNKMRPPINLKKELGSPTNVLLKNKTQEKAIKILDLKDLVRCVSLNDKMSLKSSASDQSNRSDNGVNCLPPEAKKPNEPAIGNDEKDMENAIEEDSMNFLENNMNNIEENEPEKIKELMPEQENQDNNDDQERRSLILDDEEENNNREVKQQDLNIEVDIDDEKTSVKVILNLEDDVKINTYEKFNMNDNNENDDDSNNQTQLNENIHFSNFPLIKRYFIPTITKKSIFYEENRQLKSSLKEISDYSISENNGESSQNYQKDTHQGFQYKLHSLLQKNIYLLKP